MSWMIPSIVVFLLVTGMLVWMIIKGVRETREVLRHRRELRHATDRVNHAVDSLMRYKPSKVEQMHLRRIREAMRALD